MSPGCMSDMENFHLKTHMGLLQLFRSWTFKCNGSLFTGKNIFNMPTFTSSFSCLFSELTLEFKQGQVPIVIFKTSDDLLSPGSLSQEEGSAAKPDKEPGNT